MNFTNSSKVVKKNNFLTVKSFPKLTAINKAGTSKDNSADSNPPEKDHKAKEVSFLNKIF